DEAGPAGARVELVGGREQRLAGNDVDVDSGLVVVPELVPERRLGATALGDLVLHGGQRRPQLPVGLFLVGHAERVGPGRPGAPPGAPGHRGRAYFGWATVRRYGFSVLKPCGYFFLASSSDTEVGMMTSWPGFQFTGVATVCLAVSWQESSRRITSSKLRQVLIWGVNMGLTLFSSPTTNTKRKGAW